MSEVPSWLPTSIVMVIGLIVQAVMLREQVRSVAKRMGHVESKIDAITPRMGEVERLRRDVDEHDVLIREIRDVMLSAGYLQPTPRRRTRTPAAGYPAQPQSRESEET